MNERRTTTVVDFSRACPGRNHNWRLPKISLRLPALRWACPNGSRASQVVDPARGKPEGDPNLETLLECSYQLLAPPGQARRKRIDGVIDDA